tara:strand:+ start:407 stop:679 length:273 start_codon:yes stop_codon:yes gene_type:complete
MENVEKVKEKEKGKRREERTLTSNHRSEHTAERCSSSADSIYSTNTVRRSSIGDHNVYRRVATCRLDLKYGADDNKNPFDGVRGRNTIDE